MPLLCCTSIIKVKMNCCFVLVFLLCGLARRVHLNINYNYNYVGPMYTTSDITPSSQLTLLMCPSFDYKYFPACPSIVAGWKAKKYQQLRSTDKKGPVIVTTLLLMQAGDINPNPGPNNTSCAICDKSVLSNHRATLCNKCNCWYHIECMVMTEAEKESLQNRQVSWICCHCSNPNFDSSLLSNSSIELSNSFSVLSSDDYTDSLSSPLATSSPYKQRNNNSDIRPLSQ